MDKLSEKSYGLTLETLLQKLNSGVTLLKVGYRIRYVSVNEGFCQMAGKMEKEFLLPCSLKDIGIHPDYQQEYEQILRKVASTGKEESHIHRMKTADKKSIWRRARVVRLSGEGVFPAVLLELSRDITDLVEKDRMLKESNERLRVAFHQTPHKIWEVDVKKGTYNQYNVQEERCLRETEVPGFPDALLQNGMIHPGSGKDFREFAERILAGERGGSGNFIIRDDISGCYNWVSFSYRMAYDREGLPSKAIGVQQKLPDLSGISAGVFPRRPLPEVMRRHLLVRMKVNLTADYVAEIWAEGVDQTAWTLGRLYSDIIREEKRRWFTRIEEQKFQERFQREHLLKAFADGELWSAQEYRRVDEGGTIRWTSDLMNLVEDPKTHEVYLFACLLDSQKRHEWEQMVSKGCQRDPKTGLYDYASAKEIARCLEKRKKDGECALSLIRIGGSEWFREYTGEREKTAEFITVALSMLLGGDCVVSVQQKGHIFAFFPEIVSRLSLKRQIEDAFAYLRVAMEYLPGMDRLRLIAGTVTEEAKDIDPDMMLTRAEYLCDLWKDSAMDTVAFPSEDEDWAWANLKQEGDLQGASVDAKEMERPLTKEEQSMAFRCVTEMMTADSLESSMTKALRCIGRFYEADRTYIFRLSDDFQTVTMAYEWNNRGKQSINRIVSGMPVKKIPLLNRCLREKNPIFLESANLPERRGPWNFAIFPMKQKGKLKGFLCVENAGVHLKDAAVMTMVLPYIQGERRRFEMLSSQTRVTGQDALTRLPNLSSYMDVIYSLDSDMYSSMGAVTVDVPSFSVINSNYGFDYGRKMLICISDTLSAVFGKAFIFRTWDAEFVALFPNTIQEVFIGRCTRLNTILQRRYPRQIRIGYVWSEGVFKAHNLVRESQAIMRSEDPRKIREDQADFGNLTDQKKILRENFVPYYQPKIDMRNGTLVGAEALARGIDGDGNILSPDQFVERMEQDGSIRDLDLFMLESVLKQLSQWKEQGRLLTTISLNISRVTLFNPASLASVLAIQSRYPQIPADQIELEITETAGGMEKDTLERIVNNFRECGIGFELDDFGSGYANMSMLSNIRFNTVKLDRSLVNDLPGNEISNMLVENVTKICQKFNMQCVAEGVETIQQRDALLKAGCVYGQGYYYAKPLPVGEFESNYLQQTTYS